MGLPFVRRVIAWKKGDAIFLVAFQEYYVRISHTCRDLNQRHGDVSSPGYQILIDVADGMDPSSCDDPEDSE